MTVTFQDATHLGLGVFIQVLQDGHPLGRIFHTTGGYRFYPGDELTLGARSTSRTRTSNGSRTRSSAKYRTARS